MSDALLGARALAGALRAYAAALEQHRETLNRLNVFPVPDGDTGTNMSLTVQAAVRELDQLGEPAGEGEKGALAAVAEAVSHGALMGARGNSGVILCQVLRGLFRRLADPAADGPEAARLGGALAVASTAAREAVLRPAEGTILTVAAGAATAAGSAVAEGGDLLGVARAAREGAREALWRTPQLLPVLAEAGVVDAGGAGLLLLYDALLEALGEQPVPEVLDLPEAVAALVAGQGPGPGAAPAGAGEGVGALRYEVMYLLEAPDEAIPAFKEVWAGIGDSIVVVGGEGLWNCHVHTDDMGAAGEAALDAGRPREIRVTDLAEQVEEEQWVRQGSAAPPAPPALPAGPPPRTSVVSVATGEGVQRIFRSLGVGSLVAGGQSMNPSTAEILAVVEAAPGDEVVILPNNANIFPVAAKVAEAAAKPVRVVPTRGIPEGFAALLEYDPQASSEENAAAMAEAATRVVAGEVTQAVRAAETPAGPVASGEWIGLSRSGIETVSATLEGATCALVSALLRPEHEILTLIAGSGASAAATRAVSEWVRAEHPGLTLELHRGGQPLYPFLLSIE